MVNVLLLLGALYKQHLRRPDELGRSGSFSQLSGLHSLDWQPEAWLGFVQDFNATADKVTAANERVKTRQDAGRLSKDKTRLLQFCPTVDLLEKAIFFLGSQTPQTEMEAMTPEELVRLLSGVDITQVLATSTPEGISGRVSAAAVRTSRSLAQWFSKQYSRHERMPQLIRKFKEERKTFLSLHQPRPAAFFALAQDEKVTLPGSLTEQYKRVAAGGFAWSDFVMDPVNCETAILQARYELWALALAGLLAFRGAEVVAIAFPERCDLKAQALIILEACDPGADLMAICSNIPHSDCQPVLPLDLPKAGRVAKLLSKYMKGEEAVTMEARVEVYVHVVSCLSGSQVLSGLPGV